ncbi:uncharacterized protein LOC118185954 [Stegodyphus dumicola]|uniref:uncharacterized protein LOC118185954 n=1 Tax=Stegodyphus dumicola TaxID=202533 RepID=UPI0015A7BDC4|nr:uncharacterized protein LOC118185954 [Stegodyphus dumicola]
MHQRNEMVLNWLTLLTLQAFLVISKVCAQNNNSLPVEPTDCQLKIYGCTKLVRPMLNDVTYMFPTTLNDVDTMCKMWSRFVDCVRRYMSSCSTEEQRSKFNKAVSHSMDTVHAICSSDRHQRDYLESAHCFRRVSVQSCGRYYRPLVAQVVNRAAEDTHICCAYGQFKGCVSAPLLRNCGLKVHALLDHSLSYLVSICSNTFYPLSYKCPTAPPLPPMMSLRTTTPLLAPSSTSELPSTSTDVSTDTVSRARTIIFSLPPTQGSRVSAASTGTGSLLIVLRLIAAIWVWIFILSS